MLRRAKRLRYNYFEIPAYISIIESIDRSFSVSLASRDFSSRCVIAFEYFDYVFRNAKNERRFERFELASDRPMRSEMIFACRWKRDTRIKVRMIRGDCRNECRVSLWSVWPTIRPTTNTSYAFRCFLFDLWPACAWMVAFVRRYRELRIFSWIMAVRMHRSSLMLRSFFFLLLLPWNLNVTHAARGFRHNTRHGEFLFACVIFLFLFFLLSWNRVNSTGDLANV